MEGAAAFSIRRARAGDVHGIRACLLAAFDPYRESYTPGAFDDTVPSPELLLRRIADMALFVAEAPSGEILATVGGSVKNIEEGHLRGMAVLPGCAGTGIAQRLLETVEDELRDRGCRRITLGTTKPLTRAIRFYERNGYSPTGVGHDYFGMTRFEYAKELG